MSSSELEDDDDPWVFGSSRIMLSERERREADIIEKIKENESVTDLERRGSALRRLYVDIDRMEPIKSGDQVLKRLMRRVACDLLRCSIELGPSTANECLCLVYRLFDDEGPLLMTTDELDVDRDVLLFVDQAHMFQLAKNAISAGHRPLLHYSLKLIPYVSPFYLRMLEITLPALRASGSEEECEKLCDFANSKLVFRRPPLLDCFTYSLNASTKGRVPLTPDLREKSDEEMLSICAEVDKAVGKVRDKVSQWRGDQTDRASQACTYIFPSACVPETMDKFLEQLLTDRVEIVYRQCSMLSPYRRHCVRRPKILQTPTEHVTPPHKPCPASGTLAPKRSRRLDVSTQEVNAASGEGGATQDKRRSSRGFTAASSWAANLAEKVEAMITTDFLTEKSQLMVSRGCVPIRQFDMPSYASTDNCLADDPSTALDDGPYEVFLDTASPECVVDLPFAVCLDRVVLWLCRRRHVQWPQALISPFCRLAAVVLENRPQHVQNEIALGFVRVLMTHPVSLSVFRSSTSFAHAMSSVLLLARSGLTEDGPCEPCGRLQDEARLFVAAHALAIKEFDLCLFWLNKIGAGGHASVSCPGGTRISSSQLMYQCKRQLAIRSIYFERFEDQADLHERSVLQALRFGFDTEVVRMAAALPDKDRSVSLCCRILKSVDFLSADILRLVKFDCSVGQPGAKHSACVLSKLLQCLQSSQSSALLDCDTFWIWLHNSFETLEMELSATQPLRHPNHLVLLDSIHERIGRYLSCCRARSCGDAGDESDDSVPGEFLRYAIKRLYQSLTDYEHSQTSKNTVLQILEQAIYCLWGASPNDKRVKTKYIVDHQSTPIAMTVEDCHIVYSVLAPSELPDFMGPRNPGSAMSPDRLTFCKIEGILGWKVETAPLLNWLTEERSDEEDLQAPVLENISNIDNEQLNYFRHLYYLVADYYFKGVSVKLAEEYYLKDLCLNPDRFNSWAGLCLCYKTIPTECREQVPTGGEKCFDLGGKTAVAQAATCSGTKPERSYKESLMGKDLDLVLPIYHRLCNSFRLACRLSSKCRHTLFIEYGSINYSLASIASKMLKRLDLLGIDEAGEKMLTDLHQLCLRRALRGYELADGCTDETHREEWLHHLMFGKLCLKRIKNEDGRRSGLDTALLHFCKSIEELNARGAAIPKRINYSNAPCLSKELVELHYMVGSACLKWLVRNPNETVAPGNSLNRIKEIVNHRRGFVCRADNAQEISAFIDALKPDESDREPMAKMAIRILIAVLRRYKEHYKASFRIAWFFLHDKQFYSRPLARAFLLDKNTVGTGATSDYSADSAGGVPTKFRRVITPGLFSERTRQLLFNGIWRMNASVPHDLERPGSFAASMYRSIELLIELFSNEPIELTRLSRQLFVKPDSRYKFLSDCDRIYLCRRAYFEAVNGFMAKLQSRNVDPAGSSVQVASSTYESSILKNVYSLWTFGSRSLDLKDSDCRNALNLAYTQLTGREPASFDVVLRFCSNRRTGDSFGAGTQSEPSGTSSGPSDPNKDEKAG